MPLEVRPGYVNPLATMGQTPHKLGQIPDKMELPPNELEQNPKALQNQDSPAEESDADRNVKDLQLQKQTLQNRILMMKSTTDGAAKSPEAQKGLEKQLEKISSQLQTAQSQAVTSTGAASAKAATARLKFDTYERGSAKTESPGLYQIQKDEENGSKVSFQPFSSSEEYGE